MQPSSIAAALSQMNNPDAALRKPAEQFLRENEQATGFCAALLEVTSSVEAGNQVRQLAAIYLKNNIGRYWAPRTSELVPVNSEEKSHIRRRSLELIDDDDDAVALQKAVLISKIARSDYPAEWGELFPTLSSLLQGAAPQRLIRVLMVVHFVLKELSSKCLLADRKHFQQLAPELLEFVHQQWSGFANNVCDSSGAQLSELAIHGLTLASKVLRRIMLFGFTQLFSVSQALIIIPAAFEIMKKVADVRKLAEQQLGPTHTTTEKLARCVHHIGKLLTEIWKKHPLVFAPQLQLYLEFALNSLADQHEPELAMLSQRILTISLETSSYRATSRVRAPRPEAVAAANAMSSAFTPERIRTLLQVLTSKLLSISPEDAEAWESDPEGLVLGTGETSYYDRERSISTAEGLAKAVLTWPGSNGAVGMLAEMFSSCGGAGASTPEAVALKEACIHVLGTCLPDQADSMDLTGWFQQRLFAELQVAPDGCAGAQRYLHRRIIWLLGKGGVGLPAEIRSSLVSTVGAAVGQMHEVVRLTAAVAFISIVEDSQEDEQPFNADSLQIVASVLLQLVPTIESNDGKLRLLRTITSLQHKCTDDAVCSKIAEAVLTTTPHLLSQLQVETQLAAAAVEMLRPAASVCGQHREAAQAVIPVLDLALNGDGSDGEQLALREGGLELMLALLHFAPPAEVLIERFAAKLIELVSVKFIQGSALHILEALVILGGRVFLAAWGQHIGGALQAMLPQLQRTDQREIRAVAQLVDAMICVAPAESPSLLANVGRLLAQALVSDPGDFTSVEIIVAFARITFHNKAAIADILQPDELLGGVMASWLDKTDAILTQDRRQLCALALCGLMLTASPVVLQHTAQVLDVWVSVIMADDFGATRKPSSVPLEMHRRQVQMQGMGQLDLRVVVVQCLQQLQERLGDAVYSQLMQGVDPAIITQLQNATTST